jgi:hypothetical protein
MAAAAGCGAKVWLFACYFPVRPCYREEVKVVRDAQKPAAQWLCALRDAGPLFFFLLFTGKRRFPSAAHNARLDAL